MTTSKNQFSIQLIQLLTSIVNFNDPRTSSTRSISSFLEFSVLIEWIGWGNSSTHVHSQSFSCSISVTLNAITFRINSSLLLISKMMSGISGKMITGFLSTSFAIAAAWPTLTREIIIYLILNVNIQFCKIIPSIKSMISFSFNKISHSIGSCLTRSVACWNRSKSAL